MSEEGDIGRAREIARATHDKAREFVAGIQPWLSERAHELSREMIRQIEDAGVDDHEAYEATVEQLVADLRDELTRRREPEQRRRED
jgi:hypothetical protein